MKLEINCDQDLEELHIRFKKGGSSLDTSFTTHTEEPAAKVPSNEKSEGLDNDKLNELLNRQAGIGKSPNVLVDSLVPNIDDRAHSVDESFASVEF